MLWRRAPVLALPPRCTGISHIDLRAQRASRPDVGCLFTVACWSKTAKRGWLAPLVLWPIRSTPAPALQACSGCGGASPVPDQHRVSSEFYLFGRTLGRASRAAMKHSFHGRTQQPSSVEKSSCRIAQTTTRGESLRVQSRLHLHPAVTSMSMTRKRRRLARACGNCGRRWSESVRTASLRCYWPDRVPVAGH